MNENRRSLQEQLDGYLYLLSNFPRRGGPKDPIPEAAARAVCFALACKGKRVRPREMTNERFDYLYRELLILLAQDSRKEAHQKADTPATLKGIVDDIEASYPEQGRIGVKDDENYIDIPPPGDIVVTVDREVSQSSRKRSTGTEEGSGSPSQGSSDSSSENELKKGSSQLSLRPSSRMSSRSGTSKALKTKGS